MKKRRPRQQNRVVIALKGDKSGASCELTANAETAARAG